MKHLFILLAGLLLLAACDQNTSSTSSKKAKAELLPGAIEGTTDAGYTYVHHVRNEGPKPQVGDQVQYHEIIFLNDSLLKSSHYGFEPIKAVIPEKDQVATPPPASYEAILLMAPGDSLTIVQNLDSFSVESLPDWLEKGDILRYELTMISHRFKSEVEDAINAVKAREKTVGDSLKMRLDLFAKGKLNDEIQTTDAGLKYIIHDPGEGDTIAIGKFLQVHYFGALFDGTPFDNTFDDARPFPFQIGRGRVIQGWDDGLLKVKKGGKITLFIPYKLAYGEAGKPSRDGKSIGVPERADIAFYVEVLDVR